MANIPISLFNNKVVKHTPPPTANYANQQSLPVHKNPLNTAPQHRVRKDA